MPTINMPRLSDTMQEGTIGKWHKQPGDPVKKGEALAEIETDKATMDLEAFDEGILERILVGEGQSVPVGQPVAVIGSGQGSGQGGAAQGSEPREAVASAPAANGAPSAGRATATGAGTGTASATSNGTAPTEAPARSVPPAAAPTEAPTEAPMGDGGAGADLHASPLARHMAAEHGIDLRDLTGTGPGGRIVRDDIEDYLEQRRQPAQPPAPMGAPREQREAPAAPAPDGATPAPAAPAAAVAPGEAVPLTRMQAAIARRMVEAKQSVPHFYVSNEVDMTDALALRQTLNAAAGEGGTRISVNDLIVKACALALETFPDVNSSLNGTALTRHPAVHIGIAVDVPGGLVVPVIRDANLKGVRAIARESRALAERARGGSLRQTDLEGGTFSVSNLGMMDVTSFIPIINPPQAAILGVGSARPQYVPRDGDGQPVVRELMALTLAADHRILYGAQVARFLQEIKRLLQQPYALLG